jgi:Ca2+/Na+ antiporter
VLLATGKAGFFSLVLAAILTGIWELLREPFLELFASRRYNRRSQDYAGSGFRGVLERLKPFRLNLLLALLFLAFITAFSFMGFINPFLLLAVCVAFAFLYFLSFRTEEERRSHIQFTPVLLLPHKVKTFSFFPLLLPFGLLAVTALFLPSGYSGPSPVDSGLLISSGDYDSHMAFQKSFSYSPLSPPNQEQNPFDQNALIQNEYLRYYLGEDGLITGYNAYAVSEDSETPPFPLEKLMDFLLNYNKNITGEPASFEKPADRPAAAMLKEWISVAFIFSFCIFDILRKRIVPKVTFINRIPVTGDKRIAA